MHRARVLDARVGVDSWPRADREYLGRFPLCGVQDRALVHPDVHDFVLGVAPGAWELWGCRGCHSLYIDPRPKKKTIGRAYSSYYTHDSAPPASRRLGLRQVWRTLTNRNLVDRYHVDLHLAWRIGRGLVPLARRHAAALEMSVRHLRLSTGAKLVDVGAGSGAFLLPAPRLGWEATGIDPDTRPVQAGRELEADLRVGTGGHSPGARRVRCRQKNGGVPIKPQ